MSHLLLRATQRLSDNGPASCIAAIGMVIDASIDNPGATKQSISPTVENEETKTRDVNKFYLFGALDAVKCKCR
jgi:hypothetical protein